MLDQPTEDGDTLIRLLTNLPAERFDAREVARLYRRRWSIEGLFQKLEAVLKSEVNTLGYPRAALLAFTTVVLAYNVLVVIQAAVEAEHDLVSAGIELSSYFIAGEVTTYYAGMTVAVGPDVWRPFDDQSPAELSRALRRLAAHVDPKPCASTLAHPSPKSRRATSHAPRCNGASPPPACCAMAGCPRSDLERGGSDSLAPALHDELVDRPSTRSASGARRSRSRTPSRARASLAGRSPRRAP